MTPTLRMIVTFVEQHPRDAARLVGGLTVAQVAALLEALGAATAARLVEHVDPLLAALSLGAAPPASAAAIVEALPLRVATVTLRRMGTEHREALLEALPEDLRSRLRALLSFAPGTAGAFMEADAMAIAEDLAAHDALERVRRHADHVVHYLYATDAGKLSGALSLWELIAARPDTTVSSIMTRDVVALSPHQTLDGILAHPGWARLVAMPVVDEERTLLGALRFTTVVAAERALRQAQRHRAAPETGRALAELFGLVVSGTLEFPAALLGATEADS